MSKIYPPQVIALADIHLEIERGEFVFLIGPSGAGKSTLVRLLYREEQATAGSIKVNELDLRALPAYRVPFLRRRVGVVFQDYKLLPRKTVAENVAFPLIVAEVSPRETRRRVGELLEIVGLARRAYARPAELSGGEQQRAALARAVINNPVLLIADEPTGNIDPDNARGITRLLSEINRRGTTCVVATHSQSMVDELRRRVVALDGGRIVRDEDRAGYRAEPEPREQAVAFHGPVLAGARSVAAGRWGLGARRG